MKRFWIPVTLMLLVVLVLVACGSKTAAPATSEPAAAPTEASEQAKPTTAPKATEEIAEPTEAPEPTEAVEPTVAPEPTAGEEDLSLNSRDVGLDKLKSYRVSWKSNWETTKDGKTGQTTWDWSEEYTAEPAALHFAWSGVDTSGQQQSGLEMWQIGDTTYMVSTDQDGNKSCSSFSSSDPEAGLKKGIFSPGMLGSVSGAKYTGTETVNGIPAKHYKYDEKGANLAGFGKMSGETWVAIDGGYVVKDIVNWEGGAGLFGAPTAAGESGKGSWAWELKDPNGSFTITPPEGCESASKGLPIMPDATDKTTMGDLTLYKTASKLAEVMAFYQKEMAAAGWKQSGEPTSMEGFATVEFAKDSQKASVTITTEGEGSQVMINVTKGE
jgi:hypothetical protein